MNTYHDSESPTYRSAIYEGTVTHHRQFPKTHTFSYRLFHVYLDLSEIDSLFSQTRWWRHNNSAPAHFRDQDYLPGINTLDERVRTLVDERLGFRPSGPIRLLTHPRTFGISFNPVSFYYCFSLDEQLEAIIAEITNIPWLERHSYVLDCRNRSPDTLHFDLKKVFHISPFMNMQQCYKWQFSVPGKTLSVNMHSYSSDNKMFTATLSHEKKVMSPQRLDALLWRYPGLPLQVVSAIYFQAGRLWLKGVPFQDHPALTQRERQHMTAPLPTITHA